MLVPALPACDSGFYQVRNDNPSKSIDRKTRAPKPTFVSGTNRKISTSETKFRPAKNTKAPCGVNAASRRGKQTDSIVAQNMVVVIAKAIPTSIDEQVSSEKPS